jgi:hypothetical protein
MISIAAEVSSSARAVPVTAQAAGSVLTLRAPFWSSRVHARWVPGLTRTLPVCSLG